MPTIIYSNTILIIISLSTKESFNIKFWNWNSSTFPNPSTLKYRLSHSSQFSYLPRKQFASTIIYSNTILIIISLSTKVSFNIKFWNWNSSTFPNPSTLKYRLSHSSQYSYLPRNQFVSTIVYSNSILTRILAQSSEQSTTLGPVCTFNLSGCGRSVTKKQQLPAAPAEQVPQRLWPAAEAKPESPTRTISNFHKASVCLVHYSR